MTGGLLLTGTLNWAGANLVAGSVQPGALPNKPSLPPSPYTAGGPTFLSAMTWLVHGRGAPGWGASMASGFHIQVGESEGVAPFA